MCSRQTLPSRVRVQRAVPAIARRPISRCRSRSGSRILTLPSPADHRRRLTRTAQPRWCSRRLARLRASRARHPASGTCIWSSRQPLRLHLHAHCTDDALPSCSTIPSCGARSMMGRSTREQECQGKGNLRKTTTDHPHKQAQPRRISTARPRRPRPCLCITRTPTPTSTTTTTRPINTTVRLPRLPPPSCRRSARPSIRATRPDTTTQPQTMATAA